MLGRTGSLAAALSTLAVLGTACFGARAGPGVAQVSSTPSASSTGTTGLLAFAECMRSHGVSNFPDPGGQMPAGIDPNSSPYLAAQRSCQLLLPLGSGGSVNTAELEAFLVFSACMRSHAVPNFPDPTVKGQRLAGGRTAPFSGFILGSGSGIDTSSPQFHAAQRACQHYLPGGGPQVAPHGV